MARAMRIPTRAEQLADAATAPATARQGLDRGAALYDAHRYWDAHEAWEEIWQEERRPIRGFYQGLILLAAGLHHWTVTHRPKGVDRKLAQAAERLAPYAPDYLGVDVAGLIADARRLRTAAAGLDAPALAATPPDTFPPFRRASQK